MYAMLHNGYTANFYLRFFTLYQDAFACKDREGMVNNAANHKTKNTRGAAI